MIISASGVSLLKSCERKFFHRYFNKKLLGHSGEDIDSPMKKAMIRGIIIHDCLDKQSQGNDVSLEQIQIMCFNNVHISINKATREKTVEFILNPEETPALIKGATEIYKSYIKKFTKDTGFKPICRELGFETGSIRGFCDEIIYNKKTGEWAIKDDKCVSMFGKEDLVKLNTDPQILTYTLHLKEIAYLVEQKTGIKLDTNKYVGFYYTQILIPTKVRKKKRGLEKELITEREVKEEFFNKVIEKNNNSECFTESLEEFYERLIKEDVYDIRTTFVPFSREKALNYWYEQLKPAIQKANELEHLFSEKNEAQGVKNTGNCIDKFGSPCPYWSQCHGQTKSEELFDIEKNITFFKEKE
jgi:hypothetical protein